MNKLFKKVLLSVCILFLCVIALSFSLKASDSGEIFQDVNSWYTFANSPDFDNTIGDFNYKLNGFTKSVITINYGAYTYNTNTINNMFYSNGELWYSMQFVESEYGNVTSVDYRVYTTQDGWVDSEYKYIFINNVRAELYDNALTHTSVGVFSFVYSESPSDMKDLMYAFVDIIPHTMKSLTSFELLGTTLFIVIGTITLVILIIKLIKGGSLL